MSFKDGQQAEYDALLKAEKEQVALLEEELQVGGGEEGMLRVVGVVMWARQSQVYRKSLVIQMGFAHNYSMMCVRILGT